MHHQTSTELESTDARELVAARDKAQREALLSEAGAYGGKASSIEKAKGYIADYKVMHIYHHH
jgi:hypothetical protein